MRCPSVIFAFVLFLVATPAVVPRTARQRGRCDFSESAAKESGKPVNDVAIKLHQQIGKPEDNIIFSPVSIALALALLEAGADGKTRDEIVQLIGVKGSNDSGRLYQALQSQLQIQSAAARLEIANGFFPSEKLRVESDYVNHVRKCFNTDIMQEPFQVDPEKARRHINEWVANRTGNKIPELFKSGSIDQTTLAVLANAVYLNAAWMHHLYDAGEDKFYRFGKENQEQKVKFMSLDKAPFGYHKGDQVEVLELPYKGVPLSMFIILPNKMDGIGAVEKSLTGDQLVSLFGKVKLQPHGVTLMMPKFMIRQSFDLTPVLEKLGLKDVFSSGANFSPMSMDNLRISKVVHEAFIKVYENGTEAAAVTAEQPVGLSLDELPESFMVNHPFIFAIVHKPTSAIVFMGRVNSIDKQE